MEKGICACKSHDVQSSKIFINVFIDTSILPGCVAGYVAGERQACENPWVHHD